ncbi:hypothetical protein OS493_035110, partial [Desmophyllum pertusum]
MTVSLTILVAFLCPVAQSYCLRSACSADSCKIQVAQSCCLQSVCSADSCKTQ